MAFTREQLFAQVWGESFVGETRTVDMHIRTLRQKLGEYCRCISRCAAWCGCSTKSYAT